MRKYILAFLVAGLSVTGAHATFTDSYLREAVEVNCGVPASSDGRCFQLAQANPTTTVKTDAPVTTTTTTVKGGGWAAAILEWIQVALLPTLGAVAIAVLLKIFAYFGIQTTEVQRNQLQDIIVNGLNSAASKAATDLRSTAKLDFTVKSQIVNDAIKYAQDHGAETIKALGLDPQSGDAVEAIKARIETALNDPRTPTPAPITPPSGMPTAQPLAPRS